MREKSRRVKALIKKEFLQIVRDPSSILIALVFPLILLFIYGYGISLDMNNLKVGLIVEDTSNSATSLKRSLLNSRFFHTYQSNNEKQLVEDLIAFKIHGIIKIPFYFTEYSKKANLKGPIFVVSDGSSPNTANFVQNYALGAWKNFLIQKSISNGESQPLGIKGIPRFWYNEELNSRYFLVPGSIAIIMTLIGTLLTALVVAREWERGTMEAIMATPITIKEFLLSKMISYFCLGIGSMIFSTVLAIFFFDLPFRGSFIILFIVSSVFLIVALAAGLLISTLSKNQFIASQISIVTAFLPSFMLSGFIFEISSMPILIRAITNIIPAKYMVSSLQTLFLTGTVKKLLLINTSVLGFLAIFLFIIIFLKSRKRLD